jgi:arylsulfatase A-like enzyme
MKKPNLLFLYTDEQAINTLAAYGNTQIEMPNLNELSEESCVFEKTYVTQPVCTPSRSTLLTGLYPHTNGCVCNNIPLKKETPCLPEILKDNEYRTAHFGKWHLGDEIFLQHGFDEWISIEDAYSKFYRKDKDKNQKSNYHKFLIENGFKPESGEIFSREESARLPEEFGKPAFLARESERFIEENKDNPFVLYVNFLEPHMPFFGPRDNQYKPEDIPLPSNFNRRLNEKNPLKTRLFAHNYNMHGYENNDLSAIDGWKQLRAKYWGLCTLVDTYVGRIIDKLKECRLYDNTIIVFTSDHGDMMGSHGLLAKCVLFEEAVRVPFLVKLSGQKKQKRIQNPVSQIDIVPTLLDLLQSPVPSELQGSSLKDTLLTNKEPEKDVIIEWTGTNGAGSNIKKYNIPEEFKEIIPDQETLEKYIGAETRTAITPDGWKYNWSPLGEDELYNLNEDKDEINNLAFEESQKQRINDFKERIKNWQIKTNDKVQIE